MIKRCVSVFTLHCPCLVFGDLFQSYWSRVIGVFVGARPSVRAFCRKSYRKKLLEQPDAAVKPDLSDAGDVWHGTGLFFCAPAS